MDCASLVHPTWLRPTIGTRLFAEAPALLSALLTLVAWARAPFSGQQVSASTPVAKLGPLVSLRGQLWLQELRRVLATVSRDPAEIVLHSEASVLSQRERLCLPVIQCRHCHATAWLALKPPRESRVVSDLQRIYASFFARFPDTFLARFYPVDAGSAARSAGFGRAGGAGFSRPISQQSDQQPAKAGAPSTHPRHWLCGQCGHLMPARANQPASQCPHCRSEDLVLVETANAIRTLSIKADRNSGRDAREVKIHDDLCPVCAQRGGRCRVVEESNEWWLAV